MINDNDLPIIGAPKLDPNSGTKVIKFGKFVGTIYPEIYQRFVFKLHKEHPDLIAAMQMAQVKLEDGSAVDYLKQVLGCKDEILPDMTMEMGFTILYSFLEKRSGSRMVEGAAMKVAIEIINEKLTEGAYRDASLAGTPLFPDADIMLEEDKWRKKRKWQDEDKRRHDRGDKEIKPGA